MVGTVTNAQQQHHQQQQANGIKAPASSQTAIRPGSAAAQAWPMNSYAHMQQAGVKAPQSQAPGSALTYAQLQSIMASRGATLTRPAQQPGLPAGMMPVSNAHSAAAAAVYAQPRPAYMQPGAQQLRPAQSQQPYLQTTSQQAHQQSVQAQKQHSGLVQPRVQQPHSGLTQAQAQQPQASAQAQQQAQQYAQQQAQGIVHSIPGL